MEREDELLAEEYLQYCTINTANDVLRERYLFGAELVGKYQFPQLPVFSASPEGCRTVEFNRAISEKNPRDCVCHFFIDDYSFDPRVWSNMERYIPILQNYKYVISPDYSIFDDSPLCVRIYQAYRVRASAYYLALHGVNVIPCVEFGGEETWDFAFDGLAEGTCVGLTTNGVSADESFADNARRGVAELCRRVHPSKIVVVGHDIGFDLPSETEICFLDNHMDKAREKMTRGKRRGKYST